jgi:membrane-associated phospholipid phosphatase
LVDVGAFTGFDAAIEAALHALTSPALTRVMWLATVSGDTAVLTVWTVLAVLLLWTWGRRRFAVALAALMAVDPIVVSALKSTFARARPPLAGMLIAEPSGSSFPSGHATAALVFYGLLAVVAMGSSLSPRLRACAVSGALAIALLVGVSRVFLGVHFASDVLAGWVLASVLVGAGWGALALWRRLRGLEEPPGITPERRAAILALAATVAVGVWLLQTYADPLL